MPPKTAHQKVAFELEKLMADPLKAVDIPEIQKPPELRPPRDMMPNVQGSVSGAGSGEFHVYKLARRREYERLREMEREDAEEKAETFSTEIKSAVDAAAEAKLAKNRAKRQRRKKGKSGNTKTENSDPDEASDQERQHKKKRILGTDGTGVMFRAPGSELAGVLDPLDSPGEEESKVAATEQPRQPAAAPAEVQNTISIVDDD